MREWNGFRAASSSAKARFALSALVLGLWGPPTAADDPSGREPGPVLVLAEAALSPRQGTPAAPPIGAAGNPGDELSGAQTSKVLYRPPSRGAPRAKVGGGNRGAGALPTPLALAPDHVGLTQRAQPSLFWHLDLQPPAAVRFVFTLAEEDGIEPLVEREIPSPTQSGIQRVRLAELGVELLPGRIYVWSVALVSDPVRRSRDVIGLGYVERIPAAAGSRPGSPAELAAEGLWYDALAELGDQIDARPGVDSLRDDRNSLLRQARLLAAIEPRGSVAPR